MILKQQRCQLSAQVPLDMIGEHANQSVAAHRGFAVDVYRAKIKIGFQVAECAFDLAQDLVELDRPNGADGSSIQASADHIDGIQAVSASLRDWRLCQVRLRSAIWMSKCFAIFHFRSPAKRVERCRSSLCSVAPLRLTVAAMSLSADSVASSSCSRL